MYKAPVVIIFGKKGFLGSYLFKHYQNNLNAYFCSKSTDNKLIIQNRKQPPKELPWSHKAIAAVIHELHPEILINAIALANAEQCEVNPLLAEEANAEIPKVLAIASSHVNARMVQISTDAVFGQLGTHFTESQEPIPKSIYGKTKLQGERSVMMHAPKHLIIRTNFFGHHKTKSTLFDYFYHNLLLQRHVQGYQDVIFNPIYVKDLVLGIESFSETNTEGILHFVGDEVLSKFDFANRILHQTDHQSGLLSRQTFGALKAELYRKLDLTLSSGIRKSLYACAFDVNSGIRDAILSAKADENEL